MSDKVSRRKWYLSPRFLAGKVREKGIVWCARTFLTLIWHQLELHIRFIRASFWSIIDNIRIRGEKQPDVLYAFYDLAVSAVSFDIMTFLVLAELARTEAGCVSLHVVILPGPDEGFRAGTVETHRRIGTGYYDADYIGWRLRNILVPCCWLIPSCQKVTVCTSREEAWVFQVSLAEHIFPKRYTVRFPREKYQPKHYVKKSQEGVVLPSIQATPQARRYVSDWIQAKAGERKVITITLRESSYLQDRNSNLKEWGAFARSLDPVLYCPVVLRDTDAAFKPLPSELDGVLVFPEAVWNVELRAALYELSYLNMSVSNGPFVLCIFNRGVRYLMFKVITPSCSPTTEQYLLSQGIEPGHQLPFASPFQRYVWEDDRLEVLQEAFREMCDRYELFKRYYQ